MRFYRVMFWTAEEDGRVSTHVSRPLGSAQAALKYLAVNVTTAEPLPWRALISSEEITPSSTDPQPELGEDC